METALEAGGSEALTLSTSATDADDLVAGDGFFILYNDGAGNTHLAVARATATVNAGDTTASQRVSTITSGVLDITDVAVFNGTSAGDFDVADILFVA